jgi:hypothetical protein
MITEIGERGAFHLLAEADERALAFEALRRSSFAVYGRQRVWQIAAGAAGKPETMAWRAGTERDLIPVRSLYNNLVPGLVQQLEPPPTSHPHGLVYSKGDELLAYVEVKYGSRGIWVQPFIHPDAEEVGLLLADLLLNLANRRSRPIYLCVRSYQSWLEPVLNDLGAEAGPVQAVMVKHLAISKKLGLTFPLRALEGGQPEASAPFIRTEWKN